MQYRIKGDEIVQISETKGTIQNISNAEAVISTSETFEDSFILRGWDKVSFKKPLYVRARDGQSSLIVLNVTQDFFLSKGRTSPDEGFEIDDNTLTYAENNEIKISGLDATVNEDGSVDGVTISGGKVILSENVLGQQDIKLEKASGIYNGYELTVEAGVELTPYVYSPSVLSASNGSVVYTSHSQNEGYIFDAENSLISYGKEIPQRTCTVSGLQTTLTVEDDAIAGMNFDYDEVTVSADAVGDAGRVTLNGADMKFTTNATASISIGGSNAEIYSTGDNASIRASLASVINSSGDNATIIGGTSTDIVTNFGEHVFVSLSSGNDKFFNSGNYSTINAAEGNDSIHNVADNVSIVASYGNDQIFVVNCNNNTISAGAGNDSINNSGTNTTYIYGSTSEGDDTITGFNQATDLIFIDDPDADISLSTNLSGYPVATVSLSGLALSTILLEGVTSGSVRYQIKGGEIQTYTIT